MTGLAIAIWIDAVPCFWTDTRGATAIEYCLIAAVMAIAIVVGTPSIAPYISTVFQRVASNLK